MQTPYFEPTRAAGLERLTAFKPNMGVAYARSRNTDFGPNARDNVSVLSPYVRHRLLSEQEVAQAALSAHGAQRSEKFVQEVVWRTYWKGWMEQRPQVWTNYLSETRYNHEDLGSSSGLRKTYQRAIEGNTGIECFDVWAKELVDTGYLHNHARMWFASIWIFTLKLPWALGAEFFYHHLLDGDPATNTLSWRWVGGLHTQGKTYLARADNIEKFTNGRFQPQARDLAAFAEPLSHDDNPPRMDLPSPDIIDWSKPTALLVTQEDCKVEDWMSDDGLGSAKNLKGVISLSTSKARTSIDHHGLGCSEKVIAFEEAALEDALMRLENKGAPTGIICNAENEKTWATDMGVQQVVTPYVPVGPTRDMLVQTVKHLEAQGITIKYLTRPWDQAFWPHATAGFFKVKKKIPNVLAKLGML